MLDLSVHIHSLQPLLFKLHAWYLIRFPVSQWCLSSWQKWLLSSSWAVVSLVEMLLFGLRVGLITCRNNTSFLHASVYVNKHWRHMNHTKTFSPANASGFEYILPFEGLTTHGTSQEQLLTNNSRCRQTLNTMLYSVLGLFMLTFANPFYCFLRSGPLLCSFKIYILDTLKIHT